MNPRCLYVTKNRVFKWSVSGNVTVLYGNFRVMGGIPRAAVDRNQPQLEGSGCRFYHNISGGGFLPSNVGSRIVSPFPEPLHADAVRTGGHGTCLFVASTLVGEARYWQTMFFPAKGHA